MTTYEEDIVDIYYNLQNYFTMKNINFSAIEKRAGGKGRGEIDVLAVKTKDERVIDAVHVEVGVSITSSFPFTSKSNPGSDESRKLLKKFFWNDAEHKIKELIGNRKFRRVTISGNFDKNSVERLKQRIKDFDGEVVSIKKENEKIYMRVKYKEKTIDIEIIPFSIILEEVKELFKKSGLEKKNFQDSRYRAIQYLINADKRS